MWETRTGAAAGGLQQTAAAAHTASGLQQTAAVGSGAAGGLQQTAAAPSGFTRVFAWDGLGLTDDRLPNAREIMRRALAARDSPFDVLADLMKGRYEPDYPLSPDRLAFVLPDFFLHGVRNHQTLRAGLVPCDREMIEWATKQQPGQEPDLRKFWLWLHARFTHEDVPGIGCPKPIAALV
jgi:hypothetical protein